jgi:dihydrolipoamide dehydrogenase
MEADIVLSAVGVVANIENIGLEELGIKIEKGRIVVDKFQSNFRLLEFMQLVIVRQVRPLAHVASKEGINAAEFIACYNKRNIHHLPEAMDYGNIPGCTYCTPEIASVGMTEKAAKEAGYDIENRKVSIHGKR